MKTEMLICIIFTINFLVQPIGVHAGSCLVEGLNMCRCFGTEIDCSSSSLSVFPQYIPNTTTSLDISDNSITYLPENALSGLPNLVSLILYGNEIQHLVDGVFSQLSSLRILDIGKNKLTDSDLKADMFSGLNNIEVLVLEKNGFTQLPDGIFCNLKSLVYLNVDQNELLALPENLLSGLTNLESVDFDYNNLTEVPGSLFCGLTNLTRLDLDNNRLKTIPAELLSGLVNLERLDLTDNELSELPVKVFNGLESLEYLDLDENELTLLDSGLFCGLNVMESVDLGYNNINRLPLGLFNNLPILSFVTLKGNNLVTLRKGLFSGSNFLFELEVQDNPIKCCSSKEFIDFWKRLFTFELTCTDFNESVRWQSFNFTRCPTTVNPPLPDGGNPCTGLDLKPIPCKSGSCPSQDSCEQANGVCISRKRRCHTKRLNKKCGKCNHICCEKSSY